MTVNVWKFSDLIDYCLKECYNRNPKLSNAYFLAFVDALEEGLFSLFGSGKAVCCLAIAILIGSDGTETTGTRRIADNVGALSLRIERFEGEKGVPQIASHVEVNYESRGIFSPCTSNIVGTLESVALQYAQPA